MIDENPDNKQTPGACLRSERERRGWSCEYICDQIHLKKTFVESLEADDYDALPPPAFVKGYIRSYAKLLEIEPEPLIEAYSDKTEADSLETVTTPERQKTHAPEIRLEVILLVVLLLFACGLAYWWYLGDDTPELAAMEEDGDISVATDLADSLEESQTPTVVAVDQTSADASVSSSISDPLLTTDPALGLGSLSRLNEDDRLAPGVSYTRPPDLQDMSAGESTNVEQELEQSEDAVSSELSDAPPQITDLSSDSLSESPGDGLDEPVDEVSPVSDSVIDSATLDDVLLLKTDGESWVSVVDVNEQRLMYGILTNGTPRRLVGRAPFTVVFGAATDIEATLNGEQVDFSGLIRKSKTARFILEADGEAHR